MKSLTSKRTIRLEKKKKKMAALLEISKLNEYDRETKSAQIKRFNSASEFTSIETEPSPKRSRTECEEETSSSLVPTNNGEALPRESNLGPSGKPKLEGEEFLKLKKLLREQSNKMRAIPRFHLREMGDNASLKKDLENRVPLFLSDVQHLIMYSQIGHHSPYSPARWCALDKFNKLQSTTVLVIEDISMYHYVSYCSLFPFLCSFEHQLEVVTPGAYKTDIVEDLATIPLTRTMVKKFIEEHGSLENAVMEGDEVFDRIKNLFPLNDSSEPSEDWPLPETDRFPRTQLLLSGWQMVEENFPLPIQGLMETKYKGYVLTKDKYQDVTPTSPMFGVDCEMCLTTSGLNELTRVSVVDEDFKVVYEHLVKPDNRIIDYLTKFSGITPKMMKNVNKNLKSVQEDLRSILPADAILVGQSLNSDMHALKMMHPYIIDTSVIYNVTGDRARKTKLKTLSQEFLKEQIQEGTQGHCSIEDSLACMKLVQHKLKKHLYYGDAVMGGVKNHFRHQPDVGHVNYVTSMLKQVTKLDKSAKVIGNENVIRKYKWCTFKDVDTKDNNKRISCISEGCNVEVVNALCKDMDKYTLNIAHVSVRDMILADDNLDKLEHVDRWIEKVYTNMPGPGLCMVVFGGEKEASNGCCFLQLKK